MTAGSASTVAAAKLRKYKCVRRRFVLYSIPEHASVDDGAEGSIVEALPILENGLGSGLGGALGGGRDDEGGSGGMGERAEGGDDGCCGLSWVFLGGLALF